MKLSALEFLTTPGGHEPLRLAGAVRDDGRVLYGQLVSERTRISVPVFSGFPVFTAARPFDDRIGSVEIEAWEAKVVGPADRYQDFLDAKRKRPAPDAYASQFPFGLPYLGFLSVVPILRERLKLGDRILDIWSRTGLEADALAGLFPAQEVIASWEGSSGFLGVSGYRHWLGEDLRPSNLDVLFFHPANGLPFADASFDAVIGADTLHRYPYLPFAPEVFRVAKRDAVMVFPHVHLGHKQPEPFFERGGVQIDPALYRASFGPALRDSPCREYLLSENASVLTRGGVLEDEDPVAHYNCLLLVADRTWSGRNVPKSGPADWPPATKIVVNPLLNIDLSSGRVSIDKGDRTGAVGDLLRTHPFLEPKLGRLTDLRLEPRDTRLVEACARGVPAGRLAQATGLSADDVARGLAFLHANEFIEGCALSDSGIRLLEFVRHQTVRRRDGTNTFATLWAEAARRYRESPLFVSPTGEPFGIDDCRVVVDAIVSSFAANSLKAGDRLALISHPHPEAYLTIFAALLAGLIVVPIAPCTPPDELNHALQLTSPLLIVADVQQDLPEGWLSRTIWLDALTDEDTPERNPSFAGFIDPYIGKNPPKYAVIGESAPAVILFTSGSTGMPKGVVLSHGALVLSGDLAAEALGLIGETMLMLGGLATLGGLRNTVFGALSAGARLIIPHPGEAQHPTVVGERIAAYGVSVLSTTPAFLALALSQSERTILKGFDQIKTTLVAGDRLRPRTRHAWQERFGSPVIDYYGLTETCGLCAIVEDTDDALHLSKPIGAFLEVVGPDGTRAAPGVLGEICVKSERLMIGYWDDPQLTERVLKNGWFHTGDYGLVDDKGRLLLFGRQSDYLGGFDGKHYFRQSLERAIERNSSIREAAVVFVKSQETLKAGIAYTTMTGSAPTDAELRTAAGPHLPPGTRAALLPLTSLPRNAAGKTDYVKLADLLNVRGFGDADH